MSNIQRIVSYVLAETVINELRINGEIVLFLTSLDGDIKGVRDAAFNRFSSEQENTFLAAIKKVLGNI